MKYVGVDCKNCILSLFVKVFFEVEEKEVLEKFKKEELVFENVMVVVFKNV